MADNGTALITEANGLRDRAALVRVGGNGLAPANLAELMDFGQLMAKAGPMVGKAFRGNPGACVAITMRAMNWCMDPFAVSQKAYVTTDKHGNEQIGYEAQLVAAVIHSRAPIKNRPDYAFSGQGPTRTCTVSATFKRESKPKTYTTPPLSQITGRSPLWQSDQDQQLGYYAIRAWSRRHCPELIMGVYTPDELQDAEPLNVTPIAVEDDYDQRPAEERVAPQGPFMKGKGAKDAVDQAIAQMERDSSLEELDDTWRDVQKLNVAENRRDALAEHYERNKHRLLADDPPDEPVSTFEKLKQAGLYCAQQAVPAALEAFNVWAEALTPDKLAACTETERAELRTLYKNIKAEIAA